MWYEWIFSGIGTTALTSIGGIIIGGIAGYHIGVHNCGKQFQKAGAEAKQQQKFEVIKDGIDKNNEVKNFIQQKQVAGDKSEQIQVGGITNGK